MKLKLIICSLLLSSVCLGQTNLVSAKIISGEMKRASSTMNFTVNPNTQNYDITYHKL